MSPVFAKDELKDAISKNYIGRLEKGIIEMGTFGPQLKLTIDALDHEVGGETGKYSEWFSVKMTKTSKLGVLVTNLAGLPGPNGENGQYELDTNTGTTDVGAVLVGPSVGQIFVWSERKLSEWLADMGQSLGSSMTDSDVRIPVEVLTQEEADRRIAEQGGKRKKGESNGSANGATTTSATSSTAASTSSEEKAAMDEYILDQLGEGMTKAQFVRFAAQDATLKEYPDVKKDVVSLSWAKRMLENGKLVLDGDTYRTAKVAA